MVKRVFGRIDGVEVILSHVEGNRWSVPVPFDRGGEYVVEIIAEDEAGNQSYMAKMLFVVNTALLCAHLVTVPYYGELIEKPYRSELDLCRNGTELLEPFMRGVIDGARYYAELIEPLCEETRR